MAKMSGPYEVYVYSSDGWGMLAAPSVKTIAEAKRIIVSFGSTKDSALVYVKDRYGLSTPVARFIRSRDGRGSRWYRVVELVED